jgi:uncharacterized cupredoxin-like copper-binding protein
MKAALVAAGLAGALLFAGCAGPGQVPSGGGAAVVGQKAPGAYADNGQVDASSGKAALEGQDAMKFKPNTLTKVKPGQQVAVDLKNGGAIIHSFFSPGLGATTATRVDPGKSASITFTAPIAPGTYQFWCNEPGHGEAGMVGEVIVQ